MTVFNPEGRQLRRLLDEVLTPGRHNVEWDGMDSRGRKAAAGIYLYLVRTPTETETRKMVLLR